MIAVLGHKNTERAPWNVKGKVHINLWSRNNWLTLNNRNSVSFLDRFVLSSQQYMILTIVNISIQLRMVITVLKLRWINGGQSLFPLAISAFFLLYIDTIVQFEMIDDAAHCIILHAVFVRDFEMRHTMHYAFVNYIHAPIVANKFAVLALSFIL